jgi:anaerobic selenocysteine-containing dehydrogenase
MGRGEVGVFMGMGGNFASATPDTDRTAEGLRRCGLTVQVSTKLNRGHLITGREALILPCLGRTERDVRGSGEQFVTVENSMSVVHRSQGRKAPASEHLISEVAIICALGEALWADERINWSAYAEDYRLIRSEIEAVIPGFEGYEARSERGFVLPNGARERSWRVEGERARFTTHTIPRHELEPDQLLMMTLRSHDQYNTTIYGWDDRYRGIYGARRVVMISPADMERFGLSEGSFVTLKSHFKGEVREAKSFKVVPQSIPEGCVATYFPEANPLVPLGLKARKSHTPASKAVTVTLTLEA